MADYQLTQTGAEVQDLLDVIGTDTLDTTAQTLTGAVNEVYGDIATNASAIGTLSDLTTTEKGSLVGAVNEVDSAIDTVSGVANGKLSTLSYTTDTTLNGEFDERPTSASTKTYTFTDNGWLYLYATRGSTSGATIMLQIDGTTRFSFPAFDAYAVVAIMIPVAKDQVLKFITDSASATWTIRQLRFLK